LGNDLDDFPLPEPFAFDEDGPLDDALDGALLPGLPGLPGLLGLPGLSGAFIPSNLRFDAALVVGKRLIWPWRKADSTCFNVLTLLRRTGMPMNHFGARSLLPPSGRLM